MNTTSGPVNWVIAKKMNTAFTDNVPVIIGSLTHVDIVRLSQTFTVERGRVQTHRPLPNNLRPQVDAHDAAEI